MKCTIKATVKAVVKKVSQMENVYHEITITEKIQPKSEENEVILRDWNKLYYPKDIATNIKEDMIGKEIEFVINFYPVKRTVGDQTFTNINCHIDSIEGIEEVE